MSSWDRFRMGKWGRLIERALDQVDWVCDVLDWLWIGFVKMAVTVLVIYVLLQIFGCSSSPPAPLKPCSEMPRGYCAYTDPR